jgi:hypothetical protein
MKSMDPQVRARAVGVTESGLSGRQGQPALTIVIPFRSNRRSALVALVARWTPLAEDRIEVIICDGSPGAVVEQDGDRAGRALRHLLVNRGRYGYANDKVNGLCTGVAAARANAVLICDDDIDLTPEHLECLLGTPLTDRAFKIPTYPDAFTFGESLEAVRSLICHAVTRRGDPSPVYLARRHTVLDSLRRAVGDCLFDDYMFERELRRAAVIVSHPEVRLRRAAASPAKWVEQQVRYAYEDLSAVLKTAGFLALPGLIGVLAALGPTDLIMGLVALVVASCGAAALGRRRDRLADRCPAWIICLAPLWVIVRACAVPLALGLMLAGGFPYGGRRILRPARVRMWEW